MGHIRTVILRPYRKSHGPVFRLVMRDTGTYDSRGCTRIAYRLSADGVTIFEGDDFSPGQGTADDSDEAIECLLGFLTIRPGDTDPEHFEGYTAEQLAFCDEHAEALSCEAERRFGGER